MMHIITLDFLRYQQLFDKEEILDKLMYAGVENWEGYEAAMEGED